MATKNVLFNHLVEKQDTSVPSGKGTGLKNKQGNSFSRLVPLYELGSGDSDGGGKGNFGTLALLNAGVPSPNEGDMATVDNSLGITGGASGVPALVTYQSGAWVVSQQLSGATTPVEDLLTSTSTTNALSANQGRILNLNDIASGTIIGNDIVLTTNGGATITIAGAANLQGVTDQNNGLDIAVVGNNVQIAFDFTELSNIATIDDVNDRIPLYDTSGAIHGYITPSQLTDDNIFSTSGAATASQTWTLGNFTHKWNLDGTGGFVIQDGGVDKHYFNADGSIDFTGRTRVFGSGTIDNVAASQITLSNVSAVESAKLHIDDSGDFRIRTNDTEDNLHISNTGNVGINDTDPNSRFFVNGREGKNITTFTSLTNILDNSHNTVRINAFANAVDVRLPDATTLLGAIYRIRATDITNSATVSTTLGQTIGNVASPYVFSTINEFIEVQSDGSNWMLNVVGATSGTNLSITNHDNDSLDLNSSSGTDVTLNLATIESGANLAGLMAPREKTQLTQQTIAYGATINANLNSGNIVYVNMTGDATIVAPSNAVPGETVTYILTANGANRTATFQSVVFKEEDGVTDTSAQVITSGSTKVFMFVTGPTVLHRIGGTATTGSQTFTEDVINLAPVTINVERGGASAITGSTSAAGVYDIVVPAGSRPFGIKFIGANLNLRLDNALQINIDNSANGYDLDFNTDVTTTSNNTEISEFATGVNPNQTHSGNITTLLFSGMNAFGLSGYTLRLK